MSCFIQDQDMKIFITFYHSPLSIEFVPNKFEHLRATVLQVKPGRTDLDHWLMNTEQRMKLPQEPLYCFSFDLR